MKKHNYPKTRKPGSGGARPGAGAPKKDPTTTLAYRVPAAIAEPLDKRIREVIQEEKVKHSFTVTHRGKRIPADIEYDARAATVTVTLKKPIKSNTAQKLKYKKQ